MKDVWPWLGWAWGIFVPGLVIFCIWKINRIYRKKEEDKDSER